MTYDSKQDFDQLINDIIEVMNKRSKRKDVSLLFDIFDFDKTGLIKSNNLKQVSKSINFELKD